MYIELHCDYCNQDYEVYERNLTDKKANHCPHCDSKIDRDTWLSAVVPAFKSAQVANMALGYDHAQDHKPLFTVSFIADHLFRVGTDNLE